MYCRFGQNLSAVQTDKYTEVIRDTEQQQNGF